MRKLNCWEFKKCGRQPNGGHAHDLGICPAATARRLDGVHGGMNAGRACWIVDETLCNGELQGRFVKKYFNCIECDFYNKVKEEEASNFQPAASLFMILH